MDAKQNAAQGNRNFRLFFVSLIITGLGLIYATGAFDQFNHETEMREQPPIPEQIRPSSQKLENTTNTMSILVWTPLQADSIKTGVAALSYSMDKCYSDGWLDSNMKCIFTSDRNSLSTSDAIVFRGRRLPKFEFPPRMTHQKWIFYETEPPHKTWMFANLTKYNGLFNMTSTYAADSHIPFTRMKSCHRDWHIYNELSGEDFAAKKRKDVPVAWFASRCLTQSRREDYVKKLQEHIKVDIYGKCGDKQCGSNIREDDCDKSLLHDKNSYKFYLSFENSICDDYVSEKLWKVLNLNVVPVVMGGVEYSNMMPKDSFIDVRDFDSAKDLAKYISYLDSNDTAYNAILRNKASLQCEALNPKRGKGCNICHRLHETKGQVSVVHALDAFWGSRRCLSPEVYHQTQAVDDFEVDLEEVKKVSLAGNK